MDHERRRTDEARDRLRDHGADALVLSPGPEQQYLSGFGTEQSKRHTLLVVPAEGEPFFFLPAMFADGARAASWVETYHTWEDTDDPVDALRESFESHDLLGGDVLVNERMWSTFAQDLRTVAGGVDRAGEVLTPLRMTKDEAELDAIREASVIADDVSRAVRGLDLAGMTENEVVGEIEYRMRGEGGEGASFETIVASGPNSASPPYRAGHRELETGDPVILDFGSIVDGYLSDQTRTVVVGGEPPEGFVDAHETVIEAADAAVDAVEPGVRADEVDAAARAVIEDAGYGDCFPHVTGHGVGLDIHEPPFLIGGSYLEGWNHVELEPGMVFSIEPAIYTDAFGVRVEDLVVATEDGAERLNGSPRTWEPLE
ncbi:Xaa-Pro peptidase family protein [Halolamina litorea]|uniref:M24 family metallopeptidase n=1 Tax=Halolamina litorea TaxID=1515593 RepID=A0ABD6BW91_9EURY|nr:Xaa-Pro peptidase family protein [Halolamina litorea]